MANDLLLDETASIKVIEKNRAGALDNKSYLQANSDIEAIKAWLYEYKSNSNTYAAYKSEALRFFLWCKSNDKEFKDLKKEHIHIYIEWLKNPPDELVYNESNKYSIDSVKKLFKAGLSFTSLQYNIRVINSLLNYLVDAEYIHKNPIRLIKQFNKFKDLDKDKYAIQARILEDNEFQAVINTLNELPEDNKKQQNYKVRAKVIFALLYHLGLRVNELSKATFNSFKLIQGRCWFYLIGKGNKAGKIPVNNELLNIIKQYRGYLGKSSEVENFEDSYILTSNKTGKNLSARRIREIVKDIFLLASNKFNDEKIKQKLQGASPHDLRHLLASNLDKMGLSIIDSKEILRHTSEKTTEIYRNSKESTRHDVLQNNNMQLRSILDKDLNTKNYTEIKIVVECRKQSAVSFGYFLKAVREVILRDYTIIREPGMDSMQQKYLEKSKTLSSIELLYVISYTLSAHKKLEVTNMVEQLSKIRGLKAKLIM